MSTDMFYAGPPKDEEDDLPEIGDSPYGEKWDDDDWDDYRYGDDK